MAIFGEMLHSSSTSSNNDDEGTKRLKLALKLAALALALCVGVTLFFNNIVSVTRVGAGHVGVEIVLSGSQRGASEIPIRTGWVFYSPLRSEIIEFPTYVQTVKWTRDLKEGSPANEEMSYNSKEGMEIYSDVSLSYSIDASRVPDFYVKYRVSDLSLFTHGILRDVVRNALNQVAATYTVEEIYGEKKTELLARTQHLIQQQLDPVGVQLQQFGFIGAPRVPAVIADAITAKAQAIQNAERARNELEQTQAEAAKQVAQAEGEAKSSIAHAQGEAESAVTRAKGEAEANRIRQTSLSPQLLELRRLENQRALVDRWNGQLPSVETAGNTGGLLLQLPAAR